MLWVPFCLPGLCWRVSSEAGRLLSTLEVSEGARGEASASARTAMLCMIAVSVDSLLISSCMPIENPSPYITVPTQTSWDPQPKNALHDLL